MAIAPWRVFFPSALLPAPLGLALWLSAIGWTVAYAGAAAMLIPLALRSRPESA